MKFKKRLFTSIWAAYEFEYAEKLRGPDSSRVETNALYNEHVDAVQVNVSIYLPESSGGGKSYDWGYLIKRGEPITPFIERILRLI